MNILKSIRFRIEQALILGLIYLYKFFRGRADGEVREPRRILVWQEAKLGDMVCTTPVFAAIKKRYPETRLTVMGNIINRDLLVGHPDVDSYQVMSKSFFKNLNNIRRQRFDFACTITPNFRNLAALYLAGIPNISAPRVVGGYSPYQTRPYRWMLPLVSEEPHHFGAYAPREYLNLLKPLGIEATDTTKHLVYSEQAEKQLASILKAKKIQQSSLVVVISPVVANSIKQWPLERFAEVAEYLTTTYQATILMVGTKADQPKVEELFKYIKSKQSIINLAGELSMDLLKVLIDRAHIFISVDTGPVYIAEAFGTPTIDIVGPMAENEQPPQGEKHLIVKPTRERVPQLHIMNARSYDKEEALRQVMEISVDQVKEACDALIANLNLSIND